MQGLNSTSAGSGYGDPVETGSCNGNIFFLILYTSAISSELPMMREIYGPDGRDGWKKRKEIREEKAKKTKKEEKIFIEFFEENKKTCVAFSSRRYSYSVRPVLATVPVFPCATVPASHRVPSCVFQ